MTADGEALDALASAVCQKISEEVNSTMDNKFKLIQESLDASNKLHTENFDKAVKSSMESIVSAIMKRQDESEARAKDRMDSFEKHINDKQQKSEEAINTRFSIIEKRLSDLQHTGQSSHHSSPTPLLRRNTTVSDESSSIPQGHDCTADELITIKKIVDYASTVIGVGPISATDIEKSDGDTLDEKQCRAALDFFHNELAVKNDEISLSDILKAFPSSDPTLERIYVQLRCKSQVDLCFSLLRKLRNPSLKVVLYIPNEFRMRFNALKSEDYKLRKLTEIKHKTRIEYSDSDLVLLACPAGQFRFQQHHVPHLPPVDFTPIRTPPKGRKPGTDKRPRSESISPASSAPKNSRVGSPQLCSQQADCQSLSAPQPLSTNSDLNASALKLLSFIQQPKTSSENQTLN